MGELIRFDAMTRRDLLRAAAGLSAGLLGASVLGSGCAPQAPAGGSSTVTFSVGPDIVTLDPHNETVTQAATVRRHMFEPLIEKDDDMKLVPLLATSWRRVDPKSWEFKIRENVKFHDGTPMTVDDVKFSLDRVLDAKLALRARTFIATVDQVNIVDPRTIVLVTKNPDPILPARVGQLSIGMLPKAAFEKAGPDQFFKAPIGTGPYKFVEWVKDDHVTMDAFADHWAGKPKINRVIHKPIIEASTRVAALKTGAVDLIAGVQPQHLPEIQSDAKLEPVLTRSLRVYMVIMNSFAKPFTDVRVRQAMNYAVDVEGIIKDLFSGRAQRVPTIVGPDWFGFDPNQKPYAYDPAKAKALLAEAGFPNGFEVTLASPQGRYLLDAEAAQAVAGYLEKVGVKVKVEITEFGNFMARVLAYNKPGANPYSMFYIGYGASIPDIDDIVQGWLDPKRRGAYYTDPKHEELIAKGLAAQDDDSRKAVYRELLANLHQAAPWIFLYNLQDVYAINKRLKGWRARPDEVVLLSKASLG